MRGDFIACDALFYLSFNSNFYVSQRGAVVEWLEQLGYGAESRRFA